MDENKQPIDYEAVLADMKRQRDALDAGIAGLEVMLGYKPSGAVVLTPGSSPLMSVATGQLPDDAFFGMSITEAAKKYLTFRKKTQTTAEIAEALSTHGYTNRSANFGNTVGSVLTRNAEGSSPIFAKVSRGTWGLTSWYPNYRPKAERSSDEPQPGEI